MRLMVKDIKYFNGNLWIKKDGVWINADKEWTDKDIRRDQVGYMLMNGEGILLDDKGKKLNPTAHFKAYTRDIYNKRISFDDVASNRYKFVFKNGYIDKNNEFIETDEVPFTTTQIPYDYKVITKEDRVPSVDEYLGWMTQGNINKQKSLLALAGSLLCSQNDGVFGIVYSELGGVGKTQFFDAIKSIASDNIKTIKTQNTFGATSDSKFALTNTESKTGIIGDELPTTLNKAASDFIKDLADPGKTVRSFENKGKDSSETLNNLTIVVSTNRISKWYEVDDALKSRVTVVILEKDDSVEPFAQGRFLDEIRYDKKAKNYLLNLAIACYIEAKNNDGYRAKGFRFGLPDTEDYWTKAEESDGIVLDFAESGLFRALEDKITFIENKTFDKWYAHWQGRNSYTQKITVNVMKKRVKEFIERTYNAKVEIGKSKRIDGNTKRGLYIQGKLFDIKEGK